jgi:hypothetical protein
MQFIKDTKNSKNPLGFLHRCDSCKIEIIADEKGQNKYAEKNAAVSKEQLLNNKFPGLNIIITNTSIFVKPLANLKEVANEKTVFLIWLLAQFKKQNPLYQSQTEIAKKSKIKKILVFQTFKPLQQAGVLTKVPSQQLLNNTTMPASWLFSHEIEINLRSFKNLRSTRGPKTRLNFD